MPRPSAHGSRGFALLVALSLLPLPASAAARVEPAELHPAAGPSLEAGGAREAAGVARLEDAPDESPCDDGDDCGCEDGCEPGCCACACCPAPRALQAAVRGALLGHLCAAPGAPIALGAPAPAHAEPPYRPPAR